MAESRFAVIGFAFLVLCYNLGMQEKQPTKHKLVKLIVIVGPTASGKSSLAIKLAKQFNGEIVSADSRQIYQGLAIGSGMVTQKEMAGIPHYLLAFRNPKQSFSAEQYKRKAIPLLKAIAKKGKLPILVGGAGFWIQAVTDNLIFPKAKPNLRLRKQLEKKTPSQLLALLKTYDPERAQTIDSHNPRRLMRAIEIAQSHVQAKLTRGAKLFDRLFLGIAKERTLLRSAITKRFNQWLKAGLLDEVHMLVRQGISEQRFKEFGLHYWYAYAYIKGMMSRKEFEQKSITAIWRYAKRQMTWFSAHGGSASGGKRDTKIHWIKTYTGTQKLVREFLKKK